MANTRQFFSTIKAVGGLILPTGAATGKIWTSDSEGKGSWESRKTIVMIDEHAWAFEGEVKTGSSPGFHVKVATGNEKKLVGVEFRIESGTEVEFELRRIAGGEDKALTGFTALKAKTTVEAKEPSAIVLASKDFIYLKRIAASGTPVNFSATAFVEIIVT